MKLVRWVFLGFFCNLALLAQTNFVPAQITSDVTWSGTNLLQNIVTIRSNVTVRIAPGAKILLDTAATLIVNGKLLAEGSAAEPIAFTRAAVGRRWKGIRFIKSQESRFAHCVFEYADCAGTHLDYYDNDCNTNTVPPARNYHEAIVAIASAVNFEGCTFQNLPDATGAREGDAIAIISDDPQITGPATSHIDNCRFISIGQAIHTRFSYVLVENSFFTDHHGDNDDVDLYGESVPPPMIRFNRFINPAHDDAINPTRCSAIIVGNFLTGGDDHGIVLRDKCAPVVFNNFISNFASGGISVQNQCDALIAKNTIVNCGRGIRLFDHDTRWNSPYCLSPGSGRATVVNTIIWDCAESLTLTDSPYTGDRGSHVTIAYSNIEGGQASASVSANSTLTWGEGNRAIDPQLTTNLTLTASSPMIDAGTNRFAGYSVFQTLDGNGDGTPLPDIGADEFLLETADSNGDGIPDGWSLRYGFYPADPGIADGDPDADKQTTYQEWVADTDPIDPESILRLEFTGQSFQFPASTNRLFTVQFTTNFVEWTDFAVSAGSLPLNATNDLGFYRIQARIP